MSTKQLYEKTSEGMKAISPLISIEDIYSKLNDTPIKVLVSLFNHVKCEWKGSVADTRRTVPLFLRRSGLFITYNNGTKYITEFFSAGIDQITTEGWVKDSNWTPVPDEDYISAGVKPGVGTIGYDQLNDNLKQLFREKINVTNFPDDEDITSVDNTLKFKDREANSTNFQSKGYVILRKNLRLVNGVVKNILAQEMINKPNTIYVIKYDFDLNGGTINIPENCTLNFEGGSITNGKFNGKLNQSYIDVSKIKFDYQYLLDYCIDNQINMYFPQGKYILDNKLIIGNNNITFTRKYIKIYGDGDTTLIQCKNGFLDIYKYGQIEFKNLRIESISNTIDVGIHIKNSMYFNFYNVNIYNFSIGIYLENAVHYSKWLHCNIVSNKHDSIAFKGYGEKDVYAGPNSNFFTQCKLSACKISIDIKGASTDNIWKVDNICFLNCTIEYPAIEDGGYEEGKLITLENCIAISFIACRLESTGTQNIYLNSSCSYCNFLSNTYSGLSIQQTSPYQGNIFLPEVGGVNQLTNLKIVGSEFTLDDTSYIKSSKTKSKDSVFFNTKSNNNTYKKLYTNGKEELYTSNDNIISASEPKYIQNSINSDGKYFNYVTNAILNNIIIPSISIANKPIDINNGNIKGSMFIDSDTGIVCIINKENEDFRSINGLPIIANSTNVNTQKELYKRVKLTPVIYNTYDNKAYYSNGYSYKLVEDDFRGVTSNRPNLTNYDIGFQYFDTTLNKPIWWTGTKWVDGTGADV